MIYPRCVLCGKTNHGRRVHSSFFVGVVHVSCGEKAWKMIHEDIGYERAFEEIHKVRYEEVHGHGSWGTWER